MHSSDLNRLLARLRMLSEPKGEAAGTWIPRTPAYHVSTSALAPSRKLSPGDSLHCDWLRAISAMTQSPTVLSYCVAIWKNVSSSQREHACTF